MRKKVGNGLVLALSAALLLAGCGKKMPEEAKASDSKEVAEVTSGEEYVDPEVVAVEATEEVEEEAQSEYPSIGKVSYDSLFSAIDKKELDDFVYDYFHTNETIKDETLHEAYEDEFMGSMFLAYGIPETENCKNALVYMYRTKYMLGDSKICKIYFLETRNIVFESEGKVKDFQFERPIDATEGKRWPYDDKEAVEFGKDEDKMYNTANHISNNIFGLVQDDASEGILKASAQGTLVWECKIDSENYTELFQQIKDYYEADIYDLAEYNYPELCGINTGTFSQGD